LVKQFNALFKMEGVELCFKEEALRLIAKKAIKRKIGARGLRSILEDILLDTMYELPSLEDLEKVIIDENAVSKNGQPVLVFRKERDAI
jgi:ATP-dependent Clp protease ATP-binding subunit ClpX